MTVPDTIARTSTCDECGDKFIAAVHPAPLRPHDYPTYDGLLMATYAAELRAATKADVVLYKMKRAHAEVCR